MTQDKTQAQAQDSTALARSFLDDDSIDLEGLPAVTMEPARLYYYHGVDAGKIKTPGVFFGHATAFTEGLPEPWEADDRYFETDGPGYSAPRLRIAVIGQRDQWFVPGENTGDKITWIPNGQRSPEGVKAKKNVEYLILVDGLPDPMVLSVSGAFKSKPMEDIMRAYERGALAQLMRQKKRAFPRWAFWLTVGGKVDSAGRPVLEKAQDAQGNEYGSIVTPPALLAAPELVDAATMRKGIETWNLYNSLGWFKFQRTNAAVQEAEYTVDEVRQLPAGRNVPQPVEDGDLF